MLGVIVALFSAGRLVSSLMSGWLAKHTSDMFVFDLSLVVDLVGAALYMFAYEWGMWALLLSRICLGFGSGT